MSGTSASAALLRLLALVAFLLLWLLLTLHA